MAPSPAGSPDAAEAPLALVARSGNALRLAAVDRAGRRQGLHAGMALADARARCPALATLPHAPQADARALDALAAGMMRFTPIVATDPLDGLLLDITGCAHLFGGEAALARQAVAQAGYSARHALAAHAATARALARFGAGERAQPHALPIAALELPEDTLSGLRRAGLGTLGDLARRPMAGLAARFGELAVQRLRAILGEVDSPLAPRQPGAPIRARLRFAEPLIRTDDALEAIETLLGEVAGQMAERHLGGRRFVAVLARSDGARRQLVVDTGQPLRNPQPVMRLMRERIDTLSDPLDPGFGFDAIALLVPRTEPLAARQIALEGASAAQDTLTALIDRLATRLGPEHIRRLAPRDSHIPEHAQRLRSALHGAPPPWPEALATPPRPLFLFDPPQPITAIAGVPDGPPQRFRWRGHLHDVRLAEGPERIAAEWWRQSEGHLASKAPLTRDYYRVEDTDNRRFWVFRHGLFEETGAPRWYLHGLFP